MTDALTFDGVVKTYGWRGRRALDGLTFRAPRGCVVGLVGPNGAGKTTAFSIAAGFLRPDQGTVRILGEESFDPWRLKSRFGVLPQDAELPDRHTPVELLEHLARLQGMSGREARKEAERVLAEVLLTGRIRDRVASLSHGMRRRVAVASALLGSPELVLLDEPMSGLDPVQAASLRDVLSNLRGRTTVVISSHDLAEVERLSDWVVMIAAGRCVGEGTVHALTGRDEVVHWTLAAEVPLDTLRIALPGHDLTAEGVILTQRATSVADLDRGALALMGELARLGVPVREVRRGVGLEKRFLADTTPTI